MMARFPQSGEVWKEYREIEDRAQGFEHDAKYLGTDEGLEEGADLRRPLSRGDEAIVQGLLGISARIEALTYVLQLLEDSDK